MASSRFPADAPWWHQAWAHVSDTFSDLVRVRTIESRDAALLQPQQGYYLRENIKLQLLNARMALLARQPEIARSDVQRKKARPPLACSTGKAAFTTAST